VHDCWQTLRTRTAPTTVPKIVGPRRTALGRGKVTEAPAFGTALGPAGPLELLGRGALALPATYSSRWAVEGRFSCTGLARPGQARPGQARPGQARPGQARPGQEVNQMSRPATPRVGCNVVTPVGAGAAGRWGGGDRGASIWDSTGPCCRLEAACRAAMPPLPLPAPQVYISWGRFSTLFGVPESPLHPL
jgi:hypothetical protein